MAKIKYLVIVVGSFFFSFEAGAQHKEQLLGDWYFTKATTKNEVLLNRFFWIRTVSFKRGGTIRINEFQNDEWHPDEIFDYYVQNDLLFLVQTKTNLDPTYKIYSLTFDELIMEYKNELYHFSRIIRTIKREDSKDIYLRDDTITVFDKPFVAPRFKRNLSAFFLERLSFLKHDSMQLVYVGFKLEADGSISKIEIKNRECVAAWQDTITEIVKSSQKYWSVAQRGKTKLAAMVGFAILVQSPLVEEITMRNIFREISRLSEDGYIKQREGDDRAALLSYSGSETLFNYLEFFSFYGKQSFDLPTVNAYVSAIINKSIILQKMGMNEKACEALRKAKAFSDVAEQTYLIHCRE
ncbi:MAG: hypothetical protein ACKO1F_09250 [Flammeovirgaceae bacterium]